MLARLVNRPNSTTAGEYIDRILRARVYDVAMESPLERASRLSRRVGNEILLKREDLQPTFSFKLRGAYNKIASLSNHAAARGVICASAGNHAQGVALAASRRQIPAVILMPVTTPRIKVQAVADLGGEVVLHGDDYDSAYERALVIARERQMVFVHPFDDPDVIAGQGTCSREFMEQTDGLDMVVAPIGGGGMVSGTCLTLSTIAPKVKIYAAEPEQADDAYRSFKAGYIIADDAPETVADGLKVPLKENTWHYVQNHVTDILTASEEEIVEAMKLIWKRMKIVMEPSSAVPLATILKNKEIFAGQRIGVIITGGNVDLDKLPWNV